MVYPHDWNLYDRRLIEKLLEYLEEHKEVTVIDACRLHGVSYRAVSRHIPSELRTIYRNLMNQRRKRGPLPKRLSPKQSALLLRTYKKRPHAIRGLCRKAGISYYVFRKSLTPRQCKAYDTIATKRMKGHSHSPIQPIKPPLPLQAPVTPTSSITPTSPHYPNKLRCPNKLHYPNKPPLPQQAPFH